MTVRTLHHSVFNGKNHGRRHFRACSSDCENNADWQIFICFYTPVKKVFHIKIIGDSVTDSLSRINDAAAANWQKEVNVFCPSNTDSLFYQGKTWIWYNAVQIYIRKSCVTKALMHTLQKPGSFNMSSLFSINDHNPMPAKSRNLFPNLTFTACPEQDFSGSEKIKIYHKKIPPLNCIINGFNSEPII